MKIFVVGSGCQQCSRLYENTCKAASALGIPDPVEKVEDLIEIVRMGIMQVPALVVNGKILSAGKALKTREAISLLKKAGEAEGSNQV